MKRVAIMTFHRALNYGAKLQSYALLEAAKAFADAKILDYHCEVMEQFYYHLTLKSKAKVLAKWIVYPKFMYDSHIREKQFQEFDRFFRLSKPYYPWTVQKADEEFDCFLTGSDQIWNPNLTGADMNYFLPFCRAEKRNSYAASLGKGKLEDYHDDCLASVLGSFHKITMREKSGVCALQSLNASLQATVVCDPVFLLSGEDWKQRFDLHRTDNEKYIFLRTQGTFDVI